MHKNDVDQVIFDIVKRSYAKNTEEISVSVSIYDSKIVSLLKIDLPNDIVIGGYAPDKFIDLLDAKE